VSHESASKTLTFDTDELVEALEASASAVFDLFAYNTDSDGLYDDGGFANVLDEYLEEYTARFDGFIVDRKDFIETRITTVERKISRMEDQLERREQQLIEEYERLFSQFQQLQAQSNSVLTFLQQGTSSGASSLLG